MNQEPQSGGRKGLPLIGWGHKETPAPPSDDTIRGSNSKDTRRWCRGKLGVQHELVWQHWFDGVGPSQSIGVSATEVR